MPSMKRFKTQYPSVYYHEGTSKDNSRRPERIYYINYYKDGKRIDEKAGRQFKDDMTPARANRLRSAKIDGTLSTNQERREAVKAEKRREAEKWTVNKLWQSYRDQRKPGKGLVTDTSRYVKYIQPAFGKLEPNEILALDVDRLRVGLSKKLSPQTVKHVLNLLTWIINYGVNNGLCPGLAFKMKKPTVNNVKTEDLTPNQLNRLLEAIEKDVHHQAGPMMKLALYSGLRRGEMFKLKWKDINFEKSFITLVDPKPGPDQKIPLNDASKAVIKAMPKTSEFVFPGRGGQQRTDINKAVNEIKKKARLPKNFRPLHGLRHVYASALASSGQVDMYTLQKLLTHKSPIMTQRYSHLRDETLKRASDLASEIFSPTTENKKADVINLDRE